MTKPPFKKVFIANRGEIALRIMRTLKELGIESVLVHSQADANSLPVRFADYTIELVGNTSAETYLNIPKLIAAINESGADAVHPGYGFLSESAEFAQAVTEQTQAKFIGPDVNALQVMGDKISAKKAATAAGVPVVPGVKDPLHDLKDLQDEVKRIGYPLILKAAFGGGGRGMRVVQKDEELASAFEACSREAVAYFGNGAVFCERYVSNPRHIEFQVLFDEHGNGVHLFERDCSIQRRHQKLIEEAPSSYLSPEKRAELGQKAIAIGKHINYKGVGTIEFICESPEEIYFMEMNTRIQVEHPVTELITGIDLIAEQIKAAAGIPLTLTQDDIVLHGWAIETRINAEDPAKGFTPTPGTVTRLHLPNGPFCRVDTHLYEGYEVPNYYDSMVAKVIVWGRTREEALVRMTRCLDELEIQGFQTSLKFHEALLNHKDFRSGNFDTGFIEKQKEYFAQAWVPKNIGDPLQMAAASFLTLQKENGVL